MKELITKYLEAHRLAWAPSTIKSETARLNNLATQLETTTPTQLWAHLESIGMAPYARVTTWARVVALYDWLLHEGHLQGVNQYARFRKSNARLFKNTYIKRPARVGFNDALERVGNIQHAGVKRRALEYLRSGLRYHELERVRDGAVIGKGNKSRRVFGTLGSTPTESYATFRRELAKVGLKPHDLRKIALNHLVELGASPFELTAAAGWSSVATAASYIEVNSDRLNQLFAKLK